MFSKCTFFLSGRMYCITRTLNSAYKVLAGSYLYRSQCAKLHSSFLDPEVANRWLVDWILLTSIQSHRCVLNAESHKTRLDGLKEKLFLKM